MHPPQSNAPIVEMLASCSQQPRAAFYFPGHKGGRGAPPDLLDWWGPNVFQADLPELPELDNLGAPTGVIREAQELAAAAFGADRSWFLVNGSTAGIIAAILATCGTGDKLILPRNVHRSAISGLILSGAVPIFLNPAYDRAWDLTCGITPDAVDAALQEHPDTKAVLLVSPTYHGICSDLTRIATLTHDRNIPLLVDEAHGAHFRFHPDLPCAALDAGADLAVQSTHKVLGALAQASMLHLKGDRINPHRLDRAIHTLQSTSPNYLLLASLDAARRQIATQGEALISQTLELARTARLRLAAIPGLAILEPPPAPISEFFALDPTRLTVNVAGLGTSGYEADELLHEQFQVTCELPLQNHLAFAISWGNTADEIDRLVDSFAALAQTRSATSCTLSFDFAEGDRHSIPCVSPRDAFFSPTTTVAIGQSIGSICAELICPYPPGIPVLMPGERIDRPAIDRLQKTLALGGQITGCSDPQLQTIQILKSV
jgi:arginine decarboxylase